MKEILAIDVYTKKTEEVFCMLNADPAKGLSEEAARLRLKRYGTNNIEGKSRRNPLFIFLSQFRSPIVLLLLLAAGLSFWFREWPEGLAILAVIVINSFLGFYMELRSENSMNALKRMSTATARVLRNGQLKEINAMELVPGDVVFVEAGDLVPADGRAFRLSQLQADESALTGESIPVEKQENPLGENTVLAERTNMLYKGTFISRGNGYLLVVWTGLKTELGHVAGMVHAAQQSATPLEKKLGEFSKKLMMITAGLVVVIFIAGILYGQSLHVMLRTSVALAVAAIPEGLPIVATMALAAGVLKMARHMVIVKRLSAVETLGGTSVICTDKTGTLTMNKISVSTVVLSSDKAKDIVANTFILCNTSEIYRQDGALMESGDPLETALLKYVEMHGENIPAVRARNPRLREEPFSSETKLMATLHRIENNYVVYAKGAIEELLRRCTHEFGLDGKKVMDAERREHWLGEAEKMAASGLRVIGTAFKSENAVPAALSANLVFTGLVGMIDPPRKEVLSAIDECRGAGIRVIMITGDHPATANNIARQLRIVNEGNTRVLLGSQMKDFNKYSAEEKEALARHEVFARVSPGQKLDIVTVLQESGNVVAMTGDGINDAPALKKADIGVAMGLRGTQVAQEAADMILKDDSFTSIVTAIREGRIIFENIRKFVIYLLSCNLSELLIISTASVLNLHFQLLPLQILFINLITDVLPALALGVTSGGKDIMTRLPRNIAEPVIDSVRWKAIIFYSVVISAVCIGAVVFVHFTLHDAEGWNTRLCNNIIFFTLIFSQILHVFNMGSSGTSFFRSEIVKNRYVWYSIIVSLFILFLVYFIEPVRSLLSIDRMSAFDWTVTIISAVISMLVIQAGKITGIIRQ